MGSATRQALSVLKQSVQTVTDAQVTEQLLQFVATLRENQQLVQILGDSAVPVADKDALVSQIFSTLNEQSATIIAAANAESWSTPEEYATGLEELAIRAGAQVESDLDDELLQVARVVDSSHELELALGDKLQDSAHKLGEFNAVFGGKLSRVANAVASHFVVYPRGQRLSVLLRYAAEVSAQQRGNLLATVTIAKPLDGIRLDRLRQALTKRFGCPVKISTEIDPNLLGSIRVQVADEVIDGSVRKRLDDLKLQLAA